MNIEINPDFEKSTTLRALSAFLTLLADEADGSTKDGLILSAIVQKGLNHVEAEAPVAMAANVAQVLAETAAEINDELKEQAAEVTAVIAANAPPKRTRRTKAEMEAAQPAGNVSAGGVEAGSASPGDSTASTVISADLTIDDVRAALQRYTAVHGMPDGIALLKNYGAGRISELGVEQYPLFIAECDAVEAA